MENVLNPKKCALVLIDLQKQPVAFFGKSNPNLVQNVVRMVEAAHKRGIPVIFVKIERRQDRADVVNLVTDSVLRGDSPPFKEQAIILEGTPGAELVDELKPGQQDYVVIKRRADAFYGTHLEVYLRAWSADTILIGGVSTQFGVESAVRSARDRDFNVVVLSDCCAAITQEAHDYPLRNTFPSMARVMTFEKALEILNS